MWVTPSTAAYCSLVVFLAYAWMRVLNGSCAAPGTFTPCCLLDKYRLCFFRSCSSCNSTGRWEHVGVAEMPNDYQHIWYTYWMDVCSIKSTPCWHISLASHAGLCHSITARPPGQSLPTLHVLSLLLLLQWLSGEAICWVRRMFMPAMSSMLSC